jgi:hypothetical protein
VLPSTAASSAAPVPLARLTAAAMTGKLSSLAASICSPSPASRAATPGAGSIRPAQSARCAHVVFASRRREQGASAGGGGEQHLRARLWLAVDVRRHLLLVLVARAPLPPRSRHTKGHLPSEWMRVRMSDLDTALEGAHADVSGGTGACAGQRAAAATWCEEAARSPRPPLFLPAGGLLGPK